MDSLKLSNQMCFPLYATSKGIVKRYTPLLNELNLTYTQYITMMVLWERKQIGVKQLGDHLFLDSGTLTPLLKKLEIQGLLTRTRSQADERNLIVEITEQGELLKEQAAHIPAQIMKSLHLNEDEAATLYQLLYKLLGQL